MADYSDNLSDLRDTADQLQDHLDRSKLEEGNNYAATAFVAAERDIARLTEQLRRVLANCQQWIPVKKARRRKKPGPSENKG